MKAISEMLKNIKNLIPYFFLIAIYFFFVNLEARKEKNNDLNIKKENMFPDNKSNIDNRPQRITIPVIPYDQ